MLTGKGITSKMQKIQKHVVTAVEKSFVQVSDKNAKINGVSLMHEFKKHTRLKLLCVWTVRKGEKKYNPWSVHASSLHRTAQSPPKFENVWKRS